jgi:hypothetical protein
MIKSKEEEEEGEEKRKHHPTHVSYSCRMKNKSIVLFNEQR